MGRDNVIIIVVGTRGTGKTDETKGLIRKLSPNFPKTVIIDTFDSGVWQNMGTHDFPQGENQVIPIIPIDKFPRFKAGIGRMFSSDTKEIMHMIEKHAKNMLIVLEDSRKYIKTKLTNDVERFLIDSKQKNIDIILVFHSLSKVPVDVLDLADYLILKKTIAGTPPTKFSGYPEIKDKMLEIRNSKNKYETRKIRLN